MCGYTITKQPIEAKLTHRGVEEYNHEYKDWFIRFNSLPLSSNKTGLTQPLIVDSHYILFNGEIFNYKDFSLNFKSDLHYLAHLFKKVKSNILDFYKESLKWEGFWAISIIDRNGDVYSFTDPLGKKQLYYSKDGISSEIKPLYKEDYYFDYSEKNFGTHSTNFNGIDRYMPGLAYKYEKKANRPFKIGSLNYLYKHNVTNLIKTIEQNVNMRLNNNYDGISLLLSGGLDSNIVLFHALKYTKEIDLVSIDNGEKENVEKIADHYNLTVNFISDKYTEKDLFNAVYHYEHSLDYGSLLPNYLLFRECKNSLVLTGDGSDELFSGYNRALKEDTWKYDCNLELPFYHNIRIDRLSMAFTKEARSPLMSNELWRFAKSLKWEERKGKKVLRDLYRGLIPDFIIDGVKKPLRLDNDKEKNKQLIKNTHKKIWDMSNK